MGVLEESENHTPLSLMQGNAEQTENSSPGLIFPSESTDALRSPDNDIDDEIPFLSVLNTVVDHVMIDPTPLEPREFETGHQKVPVLRFFGPIVRGGCHEEPVQSACLYVHGAFPYLLARPSAAGPDGSITGRSAGEGHVDWDSPTSVEATIPQLLSTLEGMIQTSLQAASSGCTGISRKSLPIKVIRRISVVTGRGFYTYCPGPAAPFIRVEYYDPKLRWKVKMMLERGLDLPRTYHPDPQQYDFPSSTDTLKFHCYEAHIPYTMQFFKDYNLAGMSYIHVCEGGKFRTPLPKSHRSRIKMLTPDFSNDTIFCQDNTSLRHVWGNEEMTLSFDSHEGTMLRQSSATDSSQESTILQRKKEREVSAIWKNKETSCNLEFDCTVDHILNVRTVLTASTEDDDVHWRAVPSLREIWRQERRRMSKLLPPKDDFLSQAAVVAQAKSTPPFTLNIKKEASIPGARLAVLGMKKLIRVSMGLEKEFNRAMGQIISRYNMQVLQADRRLSIQNMDHVVGLTQTSAPPDDDDALEALAALGAQFNESPISPCMSRVPGTPVLSQIADEEYEECAELFSQRVDRGELVEENKYNYIEDFIDPNTLAPYDDDEEDEDEDDEEQMDEEGFEHSLTMLASQIMNKSASVNHTSPPHSPLQGQVDWLKLDNSFDSSDVEEEHLHSPDPKLEEAFDPLKVVSTPIQQHSSPCHHPAVQMSLTGKLITAALTAPSRAEVSSRQVAGTSSRFLHPLERHRPVPSWLPNVSRYSQLREHLLEQGIVKSYWGPQRDDGGQVIVAPVGRPPTRSQVESWSHQKQKKISQGKDVTTGKDKGLPPKFVGAKLQIDSNSRQLTIVPNSNRKRKRVEFAGRSEEIEEVEWESSQPVFSQSQSQRDTPSKSMFKENVLCDDPLSEENLQSGVSEYSEVSDSLSHSQSQESAQPLDGIGAQGGKIYVEGGGALKSKTNASPQNNHTEGRDRAERRKGISSHELPTPLWMMSIEIHVQCRTGRAGVNDSKEIAMKPNSDKDKVSAVVYVYAKDPGGGEAIEILERGCLFVPLEAELREMNPRALTKRIELSLPQTTMGMSSDLVVESVRDEKHLLVRLSSIVRWKDPDMIFSWDTQGAGIGYLIERGALVGKAVDSSRISPGKAAVAEVDLARLLGRLPTARRLNDEINMNVFKGKGDVNQKDIDKSKGEKPAMEGNNQWRGSGLGVEWDERVGAGAAAASISGRLVFSCWKLIAEEVKHPNSSYLPAMVSTVLGRRIPHHDDLKLTQWYALGSGRERWRTIHHRFTQAVACLLMFDALDIVGRAGEAARLSGVEFSQSFPGIRGSQYKVEGVLLRALKSIQSDERGEKKGIRRTAGSKIAQDKRQDLSSDSHSQTQSPWKIRRGIDSNGNPQVSPIHNVSDRSYFFYSPGVSDTNNQESLECQALTLEPQSGIQHDPVVVCDFTALYPSLIIAYNLCYSTCAGKLEYHCTRGEMQREGRTTGKLGPFLYPESRTATVLNHHVKSIVDQSKMTEEDEKYKKDRAYVAPTGTLYVSESVLKGVLPQVLDEMLSTRAMLKRAAKEYKKSVQNLSPAVLRQLEARQLALKYVANVTYGYTSATFSGRCAMPLLADTIVECGRRTLTHAMNLANQWGSEQDGRWFGAEVIYGDTDSVFVRLPGRSVKEAFDFGELFCEAVTGLNPPPVQLKLEKVYHGSMMQTKKKYCGMKFESKHQKKPTFEAKGIETIRKDQCALTQKVLRNALISLFRNGISAVKSYLFRQWTLILAGSLPISDFILTGRVRSKYRGGSIGPVQAVLARRLAEADPGRVVRHKERIAYCIVATPGLTFRLRDCVLTPMELLEQWDAYTIHSAYYITKHVNASLQRCLGLSPYNVDVNSWFESCPKPRKRVHHWPVTRSGTHAMISQYFGSDICSLCGKKCKSHGSSRAVVCTDCKDNCAQTATIALNRLNRAQEESMVAAAVCHKCNGCFEDASTFAAEKSDPKSMRRSFLFGQAKSTPGIITPIANCTCIDCPITFERHQLRESELEAYGICKALELL